MRFSGWIEQVNSSLLDLLTVNPRWAQIMKGEGRLWKFAKKRSTSQKCREAIQIGMEIYV